MAGLMPSMAGGGAPMGPPAGSGQAPMPEAAPQEGRRASEEEKGVYREFLANAMNAIYEPKTAEGLSVAFQSPQPVEVLALAVSAAVSRSAYAGLEEGLPITPEMASTAAATLAADIGRNLAESVGAPPLSDEQIQALHLRSMEMLGEERDRRQAFDGRTRQQQAGQPGAEAPQKTPAAPPGNGLMARHAAGPM